MTDLLFAEDDLVVLEDLSNIVDWQAEGYRVHTAVNGRQGLRYFQVFRPQIVVTDIKMPLMDGLEMMQCILAENSAVQFMILSSYEDFAYLQEAIRLGAKDYIRKTSITADLLLQKVTALRENWEKEAAEALSMLKGMAQDMRKGGMSTSEPLKALAGRFPAENVLQPFVAYLESELAYKLPKDESVFDFLEKKYCRTYSEPVENAVAHIRDNFADPALSNSMVAEVVGMSERRLAERFKAETSHTINDYITMVRMETAKKLLAEGRMIYEAAEMTGYSTPQYFGSVFKNYTGMTPNEYRSGGKK